MRPDLKDALLALDMLLVTEHDCTRLATPLETPTPEPVSGLHPRLERVQHIERAVHPLRVGARHAVAAAGGHARAQQQQRRLVCQHGPPAQHPPRVPRQLVLAAAQAAAAQHAPARKHTSLHIACRSVGKGLLMGQEGCSPDTQDKQQRSMRLMRAHRSMQVSLQGWHTGAEGAHTRE